MINFILDSPESVSFKGMPSDELFEEAFITCKKVMVIDFGSSIEKIFEAVCRCYSGWPLDTCEYICGEDECMKPIYNGNSVNMVNAKNYLHRMHIEAKNQISVA